MTKERRVQLMILIVAAVVWALLCPANAAELVRSPAQSGVNGKNSFPKPNEIFQGRSFTNKSERDVFFLRTIRQSYPAHWAPLLEANITVTDFVLAPDKLLR